MYLPPLIADLKSQLRSTSYTPPLSSLHQRCAAWVLRKHAIIRARNLSNSVGLEPTKLLPTLVLSERLILGFGINLGPSATGGSDMKLLICEDDKLCVLLILHRCTAPLLALTKSLI